MAAHAELVISPKVDASEQKRVINKMQETLEKGAKQARMDEILQRDIERGADIGGAKLFATLKTVAGAVATVLGAALASSIDAATSNANEVLDKLLEKTESIKDSIQTAEAMGLDPARYAAIEIAGTALGQDKGDIRGLLSGFVGTLGNDEMKNYKELADTSGLETAFFTFLKQASTMEQGDRNILLNEAFGDEDAVKAGVWVQQIERLEDSGEDLNTKNLIEAIIGRPVSFEAIERGQEITKENSRIVTIEQARQQQKDLERGLTQSEAANAAELLRSDKQVEDAQRETFELRVKRAVFENEVTMAQVDVGEMTANAFNEHVSGFGYQLADMGDSVNDALESPTQENLSKAFHDSMIAFFPALKTLEQGAEASEPYKEFKASMSEFADELAEKIGAAVGGSENGEFGRTSERDRAQSAQSVSQYEDK